MSRFANRRPDRPDWTRHSSAPLTTASDVMNAVAHDHASKRSSVDNTPMLWRKLEHLKAVSQREGMRLAKAERLGLTDKAAKLRLMLARTNALGQEVMDELQRRGALSIGQVQERQENWRAKGVRKHPERKASAVRHILERDDTARRP